MEEKKKKDRLIYVNKENFEAALCGNEIELAPVEFRLLDLLLRGHGKIQSRNYLIRALYGNHDIDDKSLSFNAHISNLRKKLICPSCSVKIENQLRV
ncbi:MAG: winged helix-turn-helix domain-containing protein, partial [Sporolactobacillus sp.]